VLAAAMPPVDVHLPCVWMVVVLAFLKVVGGGDDSRFLPGDCDNCRFLPGGGDGLGPGDLGPDDRDGGAGGAPDTRKTPPPSKTSLVLWPCHNP
jgi:hypothetical protein